MPSRLLPYYVLVCCVLWGVCDAPSKPKRDFSPSSTLQANNTFITENDTVTLVVHAGWNLISLPVEVADARKPVLFPTAISDAYTYENRYVEKDTLQRGVGYWIQFAASETVAFMGPFEFPETVSIHTGWNMIGGPAWNVPLNQIIVVPEENTLSNFFEYDTAGYHITDTLKPGKGCWVKASSDGHLVMLAPLLMAPVLLSPPDEAIEEPTSIVFLWSRVKFAESYHVQIARENTFASLIDEQSSVSDTFSMACLAYDTSYYWRVRAQNIGGKSDWSETRLFSTVAMPETLQWEYLNLAGFDVRTMAVHPKKSCILFAGTGSDFSAGIQGKLLKTTNGGESWDTLLSGVTPVKILFHPFNPDIMYIALAPVNFTPSGIAKTTNEGNSWFWSDTGIDVDWETGVIDVVLDPIHPDTMYASTGGFHCGDLYKTSNGGALWSRLPTSDTMKCGLGQIVVHPETTSIVFAVNDNLFKSTNGGQSWFNFNNDVFVPPDTAPWRLAIDPFQTEVMYASILAQNNVLLKSTDGGMTWFASDSGLTVIAWKIDVSLTTQVIYLNGGVGIYESMNGGMSWQRLEGLDGYSIRDMQFSSDYKFVYVCTYQNGLLRKRLY
jgi:photosystem II stability/assembly factor-like uncharacterized protein